MSSLLDHVRESAARETWCVSGRMHHAPHIAHDTLRSSVPHPTQLHRTALTITIAIGLIFRAGLLSTFPLREDEAIYAFWARHFWLDPLFLETWPDKPPLFLGLLALGFRLLGQDVESARLLNIFISALTIPVLAAIGKTLWGMKAAVAAGVAFAFNPYAISFAPTVFTDPLLVLAGSLSLLLSLRRRFLWAGVWLGIAIMTKQQGLFYVPLIVGAALFDPTLHGRRLDSLMLLLGCSLIAVPIIYWDSLRWAVAPSPWELSLHNYGALTLLPPVRWWGQAQQWWPLIWHLMGSTLAWLGLLLLLLFGAWRVVRERSCTLRTTYHVVNPMALLFILWAISFVALHVSTSLQTWDRYLLPLAPMLSLLIGWGVSHFGQQPVGFGTALLCVILLLFPPAQRAAAGQIPVGGDHGAYSGLHEALTWLDEQQDDRDIVLYHRVLGWHYRFYLFDEIVSGEVELRWFPSAVYLVDNAAKTPRLHRFLLQPTWAPIRDLTMHASFRQLRIEERARFGRFTIFEIVGSR